MLQPDFIFKGLVDNATVYARPLCVHSTGNVNHTDGRLNSTRDNSTDALQHYSISVKSTLVADNVKGYLLSLTASSMYVIAVNVLQYKLLDVDTCVVLFWMSICGVVVSAAVMLAAEIPIIPHSFPCISLLLGHGLSAGLSAVFFVISLTLISAFTFSLLSNLVLVFLVIAQYTVLKRINPGHRNAPEIVGAVLVFICCITDPLYTLIQRFKLRN